MQGTITSIFATSTWLVLSTICCITACGDETTEQIPPEDEAAIVSFSAGVGVTIDEQPLSLGQTYLEVSANFGAADSLLDIADIGVSFDYPELGVSGLLSGAGDEATVVRLTIYPPELPPVPEDGVELGSARSQVEAEYGAPQTDPFLTLSWYRDDGIAFEFEEDTVSRIHLFAIDG